VIGLRFSVLGNLAENRQPKTDDDGGSDLQRK
jgi:hypothetical protein